MHRTAKVSKEVNRKSHPWNTTVYFSNLSATLQHVTDRQTDKRQYDASSRPYGVQQYERLKTIHPTAKVSERTNKNLAAGNTLVQLVVLYIDPESHNAQC